MHPGPVGESQSNSQDGVATLLRLPTETLGNHRTSLGLPSSSGLLLLMLGIADPSVRFVSLHHAFPRSTTAVLGEKSGCWRESALRMPNYSKINTSQFTLSWNSRR